MTPRQLLLLGVLHAGNEKYAQTLDLDTSKVMAAGGLVGVVAVVVVVHAKLHLSGP